MSTKVAARLLNEGWELQQAGDFASATRKYDAVLLEATEVKDIPMLAHLNRGNIFFTRGDYDEALRWYRKAAEVNPSNDAPYNNIACVFRDTQRYDDAITFYKLAIEKNELDPDCRRNLALVYATTGKNTLAAAQLEKCIELSGDAVDPRDCFNLGILYSETGNEVGAGVWLVRFIEAAPPGYTDQVTTARQVLASLKNAWGFGRTRKKLLVRDGGWYVVSE